MNTKELVGKYLEGNYYDNGKNKKIDSMLEYVVRKLNLKDALNMRNCLIDKNFKMLMKDVDMIKCIEEFFKYDLNVAETSRNSYLHRNTLLYRIEKRQAVPAPKYRLLSIHPYQIRKNTVSFLLLHFS